MEKRKRNYDLSKVQEKVSDPGSRPFTVTALRGGLALGLIQSEMREVVLALSNHDFYKSMSSTKDNSVWQDVYHGATPDGTKVYIKITDYPGQRPPIIQFKAK